MLDEIVAALFPMRCPGCGARAEPVCARCVATMQVPPPVPSPLGVDAWYAPFAYDGVAREVVARVKYRRAHGAVAWLAAAMVDVLPENHADVVTWAPTTTTHRRERGFDHAELLARAVGRHLRVPTRRLLARTLSSVAQTGLASADRRGGPPRFEPLAVTASVGTVLLVDDVATTGTTLRDAALALRAAGARRVVAVTAARTPPPGARRASWQARSAPGPSTKRAG